MVVKKLTIYIFLLVFFVLVGCSSEEEDPELEGPFGAGTGGTAVDTNSVQSFTLTKISGASIGMISYDSSHWADTTSSITGSNSLYLSLLSSDPISISLTRITGSRADTPCRFQAAVLARDNDYEILKSGDRTNSKGLDFHQVNLRKDSTYLRFYCTTVSSNVGVLISATATTESHLDYLQLHHILNSVE